MVLNELIYRPTKLNFSSNVTRWKKITTLNYACPRCNQPLLLGKEFFVPKLFNPQASVFLECGAKECSFILPIKKWNKKNWYKDSIILPDGKFIDNLYYLQVFLHQLRILVPSGNLWTPIIQSEVLQSLKDVLVLLPNHINNRAMLLKLRDSVNTEFPVSVSGSIIYCINKIEENKE